MNPVTKVLLTIPKALQDELVTDSGLSLYIDPSYRKEWQSTVTATIAALPIKVSNPLERKILSKLKVGDEVAISYRVVADFDFKSDSDRFMEASEGSPYLRTYFNGKGDKIEVAAFPGVISPIWVGYLMDKKNRHIDGVQGSESQLERWMSQFQFGKTDIYGFNNFFSHNGQDYWRCDLTEIYAKKEKDKVVSVGDRVIGKPIDEEIPADVLQHIQHTNEKVKVRYQDRFKVLTGGEDAGFKKNDVVAFAPNYLEKYTFWGKQFYLINEKLITGKWCKN